MYREAKSLMSSEMEGVVLKATRPDDLPVKTKHLQTLLRPTQEMPKEFNVYLPVVRACVGAFVAQYIFLFLVFYCWLGGLTEAECQRRNFLCCLQQQLVHRLMSEPSNGVAVSVFFCVTHDVCDVLDGY